MSVQGDDSPVERPPVGAEGVFGSSWAQVQAFAELLVAEGELRGLIGPRELPRLWTRHLLNSSAMSSFVPEDARVADIGSGAGFPGVVLALMRSDVSVQLVEPMERRVAWLNHVVAALSVENISVTRARAEELHGTAEFDVVTARAVASMRKLVPWVGPLVRPGGLLLALKGERAAREVEDAAGVMKKYKLSGPRVHEMVVEGTSETTRVVEVRRRG